MIPRNSVAGSKSDVDNEYEGRILSSIKEPPTDGYTIAIVEKDDDQKRSQGGSRKILTAKLRMPFQSPMEQLRRVSD